MNDDSKSKKLRNIILGITALAIILVAIASFFLARSSGGAGARGEVPQTTTPTETADTTADEKAKAAELAAAAKWEESARRALATLCKETATATTNECADMALLVVEGIKAKAELDASKVSRESVEAARDSMNALYATQEDLFTESALHQEKTARLAVELWEQVAAAAPTRARMPAEITPRSAQRRDPCATARRGSHLATACEDLLAGTW